ncbi:MAG: outer membrane beta-barrel protein [Rhizobacter sp.]
MKLNKQILAVCIAGVCAAGAAQAQVAGTGLYVGGNIGQSKWKGGDFDIGDSSKVGAKAFVGYSFTPMIGLELGYINFGDFGGLDADGGFVDGVLTIPFTPQWSGIARAGVFQGRVDAGENNYDGTSWKGGLGVQYNLTPQLAVRAEYERYKFDVLGGSKSDFVSAGITYRF